MATTGTMQEHGPNQKPVWSAPGGSPPLHPGADWRVQFRPVGDKLMTRPVGVKLMTRPVGKCFKSNAPIASRTGHLKGGGEQSPPEIDPWCTKGGGQAETEAAGEHC